MLIGTIHMKGTKLSVSQIPCFASSMLARQRNPEEGHDYAVCSTPIHRVGHPGAYSPRPVFNPRRPAGTCGVSSWGNWRCLERRRRDTRRYWRCSAAASRHGSPIRGILSTLRGSFAKHAALAQVKLRTACPTIARGWFSLTEFVISAKGGLRSLNPAHARCRGRDWRGGLNNLVADDRKSI